MSDIRIDLSIPALAFGVGPFRFDPVATLLGCSFESIVESLMVAPSFSRAGSQGGGVEVFPLALPDGEGAHIPLGRFGQASFANEGGVLVLHLPPGTRSLVVPRVANLLSAPPALVQLGQVQCLRLAMKLRPGLAFRLPLGSFGELGVEAA